MTASPDGSQGGPGGQSFDWAVFERPIPAWYRDAKLGIFIHWGAYSVPAWAEPTGELGTIDPREWFRHNPYAEWYWNTIRIPGSPAQKHHDAVYRGMPYDGFLDLWRAEDFSAGEWAKCFAAAGARYVIPTTKHHDGIALWDAPGTGARNTVHRGPRRDLVADLARAVRDQGMRFGVYYSGGLDWSVSVLPPLQTSEEVRRIRPRDAAYATYCYLHARDLVDRVRPDVLWNDIEWPDAGKHGLAFGLGDLFRHYYRTVPEGVVNDRYGDTHWDYKTSEYQAHRESETFGAWEHCRGLGFSFGYNQLEQEQHLLGLDELVRLFVDVVSRGGNLLLNVGPTASGVIPDGQRSLLAGLGEWNAATTSALFGSRPLDPVIAAPSEDPWVRWVRRDGEIWCFTDAVGDVPLHVDRELVAVGSCTASGGAALEVSSSDAGITVTIPHRDGPLTAIRLDLRTPTPTP